jgi:hypothetical protein
MSILACYKKGIGEATIRPRIVLVLWLFNAAFASLAYVLFSSVFTSALGRSGLAAGLMTKADMNVLFEALTTSGRPLGVMMSGLFALLLVYFLASIFIQGGILGGLVDGSGRERSGRVFFAGGAAHYGRFLRLTFYSIVLWVPALVGYVAVSLLLGVATKDPTKEQLSFDLDIVRIVLAVFVIFLIKMIMDYARIQIATQDTDEVFQALIGAVRFVFGRPALTLGLYYLLGLTGFLIFVVWRLFSAALPVTTMATVWAGFFVTQLFIASRGWLMIAYQAAQLANHQSFGGRKPPLPVTATAGDGGAIPEAPAG